MELRKREEKLEEKRPLLLLPSKWHHGPGQPWVVPLRRGGDVTGGSAM